MVNTLPASAALAIRCFALLGCVVMAAGGCAALPPAQVGQTIGTIAGAAALPGIGAPIGALAGLLAGMAVQTQIDKTTETKERKDLGRELASGRSNVSMQSPSGEPTRVWVDETTQNGRVIAGHFDVRSVP